MARRLYLGKLPPNTRSEDVKGMFEKYGTITDVRVMTDKGFGFVEYESSRDAEDAVAELNGKSMDGSPMVVEFAKESKSRRTDYDAPDRSYAPRRRPAGIRVTVEGLTRDTSWQDLKDFGREAGNVSFADIDREAEGRGVLEYLTREDAEHAVKYLNNREIRGRAVTVEFAEDRGGPDNFRRDDYRDRYRERGDRHDRGYDRGDRDRDYHERRRRSVSPAPRREDRASARSPRRDRDFDDRSRRDRAEPYEDKPRREERRRDDRERFEERPVRASNGDAGYSSR